MNISKLLGLSIAVNGALIALPDTTNLVGLLVGGAIMLAGGYLVLRDEF